jgi:hypothetical protein
MNKIQAIQVKLAGNPIGALIFRPSLNHESWHFNSFLPGGAGRHRKRATLATAKAKVRRKWPTATFTDEDMPSR